MFFFLLDLIFNQLLVSGKLHPWLGSRTPFARNTSKYLNILSMGGLHVPSEVFMQYLRMFEQRFQTFNGSTIFDCVDPIESLASLLRVEFAEVEPDIINLFCKTRTFIRLKKLNNDLLCSKKRYRRYYIKHVSKFQ